MDSVDKLRRLAEDSGIDFKGNVEMGTEWTYTQEGDLADLPLYAVHADDEGVFATLEGDEESADCYNPFTWDEIDNALAERLLGDIDEQ